MASTELDAVPVDGGVDEEEAPTEADYGFVPDRRRRYTAAEVRALNAANPRARPSFECVAGRLLVTPSARVTHSLVVQRLTHALMSYCEAHFPDGVLGSPPGDISWGRRDTLVQPDVFVIPRAMARAAWDARSSVQGWRKVRHLLLVAEVLSPGTAAADRGVKRELYQRRRVPLYWIVDVPRRAVEEWTPDAAEARVERERLVWRPEGAPVAFELAPAHLFRPV